MILEKADWFNKSNLIAIIFLLTLSLSACSYTSPQETQVEKTAVEVQSIPEASSINSSKEEEKITDICIDLYKKAAEEKKYLIWVRFAA